MALSKLPRIKPKKLKAKGVRLRRKKKQIVIDREAGLVFNSEKDLYAHFSEQIQVLEKQYDAWCSKEDKSDPTLTKLTEEIAKDLDQTLDEPAEIWHDEKTFSEFPIFHFIRPLEIENAFHIAVTYVSSDDEPTFIFLHFLTKDLKLVEKYRRGDLVYDRAFEEVGFAALEGDGLTEGDPFAMGLFLAMLKVRGDKDIAFDHFNALALELREDTIENPDEIWRSDDLRGNSLVTFIKEFPDHALGNISYVVITQEDEKAGVHSLLFSFPTQDEQLLDRYRHGENLQADEVVQESSH
jgi:hypothetical protein